MGTRPILALLNSFTSWWDDGAAVALVLLLLLDLEAVPHVRGDVGTFLAFLLGLEPSDGELSCCCCSPQSTAAALMELQVVVWPETHAQYRNTV